jgi:hypothetical protein
MKSSNRGGVGFICATVVTFLSASVLFVYLSSFRNSVDVGKPVGSITFKAGKAEQKVRGNPVWVGLSRDEPVYDRDMIRTAEGSQAVIRLENETEIILNEDSMVLISIEDKNTKIRVTGGSVLVDSARTDAPVNLETRDGTVSVTKGSVLLKDSGGGVKVELKSGAAAVVKDNAKVDLSDATRYDMASAKVERLRVIPTSPAEGQSVFVASDSTAIRFAWQIADRANAGSAAEPQTLTVAKDSSFREVEYQSSVEGPFADVVLGTGGHYWKLSGNTSSQWFTVQKVAAPKQISPVGASFSFLESFPVIPFSWAKTAAASTYRLEVYAREDGTSPVYSRTIDEKNIALDSLGAGDYSWKVVAICGPDRVEIPSDSANFSVVRGTISPPSLPETLPSVSRFALLRGQALASWTKVDTAARYEVIFSADAAGVSEVSRMMTDRN